MTEQQLLALGLLLATAASGLMVLPVRWRLVGAGLWLAYGGLALVTGATGGLTTGLVKLLGGSLAVIVLWLAGRLRETAGPRPAGLVGRWEFRAIAFLLVWLSAWSLGRQDWLVLPGLTAPARMVGAILLAMGLCQIGLYSHPFRVGVGLLAALAGFEAIYAPLETSLAVAAMMVAVQLGLAITAGYLGTRWISAGRFLPRLDRRQ